MHASSFKMVNISKKAKNPQNLVVFVAAGLLVNGKNQVLLATRPPGKSMAGLWEFPGGKVKPAETPENTLIRELLEELKITVKAVDLRFVTEISHKYEDFHLKMPLFLCRHWIGEPTPQEGQEICWVSPENLENYPMPPADAPVIGKIPGFLRKY